MAFNLFTRKKNTPELKTINVLALQLNDECYYDHHREAFCVSEIGTTSRGVFYVEISDPIRDKKHIFNSYYPVQVSAELYELRKGKKVSPEA